jgi:hypothetical protein
VGGTFAAGQAMGRRASQQASAEAYQDQGQQDQPQMPAAPPPREAGPASAADQLSQLAELHQQGALTDDEFTAAKARILG